VSAYVMVRSSILAQKGWAIVAIYERPDRTWENKITSPIKAIRAFCIECMGGQSSEVKSCPSKKCPLYDFRMGKNVYHKRAKGAEPAH